MSELKPQTAQGQTTPKKNYKTSTQVEIPPEQLKYATLLQYGSWLGIAVMVVTFALYMGGIMNPYIPANEISQYWSMPASEYLHTANVPAGWGWVSLLGYGDYVNLVGIAFLALLTIFGYLIYLLPGYLKKKDTAYITLVVVEVLVLSLAASGILGSGGH